jgi:hypothetical protein
MMEVPFFLSPLLKFALPGIRLGQSATLAYFGGPPKCAANEA